MRLENGLLESYQRRARQRHTAGEEVPSFEEQLLAPDHRAVVDEISRVARERVYYLGLLRDELRVIYRLPPHSDQWSVGLAKGEHTAAVPDSYANYDVTSTPAARQRFRGGACDHKRRPERGGCRPAAAAGAGGFSGHGGDAQSLASG